MPFKINNCRLDLEDRSFLSQVPQLLMTSTAWKAFTRPAEVNIDWHRSENQGRLGSCQGHGLTSVLERLAFACGLTVQLSEIFAYLATQKIDGLLGSDSGSTISGGAKLAMATGVPLESVTGYPGSYPSRSAIAQYLSKENYEAAAQHKAKSLWQVEDNLDKTLDFLGGGGAITFGISWYSGLIPKDRVVRDFNPSRNKLLGGHAMAVLGYTKDGELKAANSHADGPYIITPSAWSKMLQHRSTAAIGLMGNPTAEPIDWYKNSPNNK